MAKDSDIIKEALEFFERASDAESTMREEALEDFRIYEGRGVWPEAMRRQRENNPRGPRPCLVINDLPLHVRQVTNDVRQNRPGIKTRPVDDVADPDTAKVFDGIIRHIEQQSFADIAYETANLHQVIGGFGYFRIVDGYAPDDQDDRELFIKPVANQFSVMFDPDSICPVGSDARRVMISEDVPKAVFQKQYPNAELVPWNETSSGDHNVDWFSQDTVKVAEYLTLEDRSSNRITVAGEAEDDEDEELSESDYWDKYQDAENRPEPISTRMDQRTVCVWRKMNGKQVLEETELPINWIPVLRVPGEILLIDGKRVYKGLVRDARDAVRMVSYWFSTYTEVVGLQPKAPYVAAAGTLDGFEDQWNSANIENYPVLQFNPVDINGQPSGPPQRQPSPVVPQGIMQGLLLAKDAVKSTTGQFDASLGQRSNETSGVAIRQRQHEGDVSTYHFTDNLAKAIRHAGRILIQWIPKVYDGKRVARIIGEDGTADYAQLDDSRDEALTKARDPVSQKITRIYNLGVGCYDVLATVGPSYTTKRQEAVDSMTQILQMNPQLFQVIGDIFVKSQDWPGADEMAKRLKTMLPPQVAQANASEDENQIPPQAQAMIQQLQQKLQEGAQLVQQLHGENEQLKQQMATKQIETQARMQDSQNKLDAEKVRGAANIHVAEIEAENDQRVMHLESQVQQMQGLLAQIAQHFAVPPVQADYPG